MAISSLATRTKDIVKKGDSQNSTQWIKSMIVIGFHLSEDAQNSEYVFIKYTSFDDPSAPCLYIRPLSRVSVKA